jgi:SAM-dependent methyltransferase
VHNYECQRCGTTVNLLSSRCACKGGLPDFRPASKSSTEHADLYRRIGSDDRNEPFQPMAQKSLRADQDFARIKRYLKGSQSLNILEIGPGDGLFSKKLSPSHNLFLLDITDEYIANLDFADSSFLGDVETMPFVEEFDVVILCDVLEHILNEGDAMLSIRRALKPGGVIYIRCPANEPLVSYSRHLGSPYPYVHLRTYSKSSLRRSAVHTGFEVIACKYVRAGAAGFARRSFGLRHLAQARAMRHTTDVSRAHMGLESTQSLSRLDWLFTKVEAVTWHLGWFFSRRLAEKVLQRVWYRPAEVFIIGRVSSDPRLQLMQVFD